MIVDRLSLVCQTEWLPVTTSIYVDDQRMFRDRSHFLEGSGKRSDVADASPEASVSPPNFHLDLGAR